MSYSYQFIPMTWTIINHNLHTYVLRNSLSFHIPETLINPSKSHTNSKSSYQITSECIDAESLRPHFNHNLYGFIQRIIHISIHTHSHTENTISLSFFQTHLVIMSGSYHRPQGLIYWAGHTTVLNDNFIISHTHFYSYSFTH